MDMPPHRFLSPGELHFGAAPLQLATLLGSCVTVTLWHPRRRIGGMCHILLPTRAPQRGRPLDGHYADEAFAMFDQAIAWHGSSPREYQAKLFGGGNMFMTPTTNTRPHPRASLGEQNIVMARTQLAERGIPLLAEHVGGAGHRKLVFDLDNGEVHLYFADLNKAPRGDS